jgi:cytidylate kinase
VATITEVRAKLVEQQKEMGNDNFMDGRDIGTVVFPNAELKIFMTASNNYQSKKGVEIDRKRECGYF